MVSSDWILESWKRKKLLPASDYPATLDSRRSLSVTGDGAALPSAVANRKRKASDAKRKSGVSFDEALAKIGRAAAARPASSSAAKPQHLQQHRDTFKPISPSFERSIERLRAEDNSQPNNDSSDDEEMLDLRTTLSRKRARLAAERERRESSSSSSVQDGGPAGEKRDPMIPDAPSVSHSGLPDLPNNATDANNAEVADDTSDAQRQLSDPDNGGDSLNAESVDMPSDSDLIETISKGWAEDASVEVPLRRAHPNGNESESRVMVAPRQRTRAAAGSRNSLDEAPRLVNKTSRDHGVELTRNLRRGGGGFESAGTTEETESVHSADQHQSSSSGWAGQAEFLELCKDQLSSQVPMDTIEPATQAPVDGSSFGARRSPKRAFRVEIVFACANPQYVSLLPRTGPPPVSVALLTQPFGGF
jgi:hypothetical protein